MTEIDRLAFIADVPADLAALVVLGANRANVSIRDFRRNGRPRRLIPHKQRVVLLARDSGFSWWQIGRALNRDHSTCIHAYRQARLGREATHGLAT